MVQMDDLEILLQAARNVREQAHAPFSGFKVGAALQDETGQIFTGCNVENATYGLSLCAERVAVFKAISEGARRFTRIAIVADSDQLTPPCGACRQILWEFCGNTDLILSNLRNERQTLQLTSVFPFPFDASFLR